MEGLKKKFHPSDPHHEAPHKVVQLFQRPPIESIKYVRREYDHLCVQEMRFPRVENEIQQGNAITIITSHEYPEIRAIDSQIAELLAKKQQLEKRVNVTRPFTIDLVTLKF